MWYTGNQCGTLVISVVQLLSVWYTAGYQCGILVISVVHWLSVSYSWYQCGTLAINVVHSVVLLDISLTQCA